MSASATDKFKKGARKWVGQIGAGGVSDASTTTIPLSSATNLPTDTGVVAVIDRVNSSGTKTPSLEETVIGVVSGSNLVTCTRGAEGTAQAHLAGAVVEILITNKGWNDVMDGILVEHNQNGTHSSSIATLTGTQILTNKTLTSPTINSATIVGATIDTTSTLNKPTFNGQTSTGTAAWTIDATSGSLITIANNATATPFSNAANFSGLILIEGQTVDGTTAMFMVGNNTIALLSQVGSTLYTTTQGSASRVNVYLSGGVITMENKQGSSIDFRVVAIRTRSSN